MRRTRPPSALLPLLLLPLLSGATCLSADDDESPVLTRLSEAQARAMRDDRLILVVLDPSQAEWALPRPETPIADEVLRRAAEEAVVVRLPPGTLDAAARYVRRRFDLYDTVGAAVVIDQEGRLFARDVPPDREGALEALADARDRREAYRRRLGGVSWDRSEETLRWEIRTHLAQRAFEDVARILAQKARYVELDLDLLVTQAETLAVMGSVDAKRVFTQLIETYPEDRRCRLWRIERALLGVCPARTALLRLGLEDPGIRRQGRAALLPLLAEAQATGDLRAEAAVRLHLLPYLSNPAERIAQMDWITTCDPDGPDALPAYVWLVQEARSRHDLAEARLLAEAAVAGHPADERLVPWLRGRLLPYLERAVAGEKSLRLEARVDPALAAPDEVVDLSLEVTNVSRRPLERVAIECRLAGPLEPLTRSRIEIDLGVAGSMVVIFTVRVTGTEWGHAVIHVRHAGADGVLTRRSAHVRVQPAR